MRPTKMELLSHISFLSSPLLCIILLLILSIISRIKHTRSPLLVIYMRLFAESEYAQPRLATCAGVESSQCLGIGDDECHVIAINAPCPYRQAS